MKRKEQKKSLLENNWILLGIIIGIVVVGGYGLWWLQNDYCHIYYHPAYGFRMVCPWEEAGEEPLITDKNADMIVYAGSAVALIIIFFNFVPPRKIKAWIQR